MPWPVGAEIGERVAAAGLVERFLDLRQLLGVDEVGAAQRDNLGLVGEVGAIGIELAAHDAPRFGRVVAGRIDQVQQHPAALDMAEEAVADAGAFGGAFDQPGDVGEDELAALVADDAELRAGAS